MYHDQYRVEFDWYFGKDFGGKQIAEEYLTDALDYLKELLLYKRAELSTAEMYKIGEMVQGLHNLRNAIRDAEEIVDEEIE